MKNMKRLDNGVYDKNGQVYISHWSYNKRAKASQKLGLATALKASALREGIDIETVPTEAKTEFETVAAYPLEWLNSITGGDVSVNPAPPSKDGEWAPF